MSIDKQEMLSRLSIEPNEEQRRRESAEASVIEPFAQAYEGWEVRFPIIYIQISVHVAYSISNWQIWEPFAGQAPQRIGEL